MGDRTWTGIQFSGAITREVAEGLIEQLEAQGCDCDLGPQGDLTIEHLRAPHNPFTDYECNYATMEGVETYCREHHISYFKEWSAGGGYGSGMEIYCAVVDTSWEVQDVEGEPVISLRDLISAHKEGKIEETINYLKGFTDFEKNYPPLEIVE